METYLNKYRKYSIEDKDYFNLYRKYKKKYLEKKKLLGGKIPSINNKVLPILRIDGNFYTNNKLVVKSDTSDVKYNFPDASFNYKQIVDGDDSNIDYSLLYKYADHQIKIDEVNSIPFSLVLLQENFKILTKFYKFCTDYVDNYLTEFIFPENYDNELINKVFKTYFVFNRDTKDYITMSVKPNLLNNFLFIGKLREILEIIFSNESSDEYFNRKIIELFVNEQNFINFYDMDTGYTRITNSLSNIDSNLLKLDKYGSKNINKYSIYFNKFKKSILELRQFNSYLDLIDESNKVEDSTPLKTKLSYLFYATFIGIRLKKPIITVGKINKNFYPINIKATLQNLLKDSYLEPETIVEETEKMRLFKSNSNFPHTESYSSSKYTFEGKDYIFPDCVENTLYQLLKVVTYDGLNFNSNFLPSTTKEEVKDLFTRLTPETNLKDEFIGLITNIGDLSDIYKNDVSGVFYEIKSTRENFMRILNYLLGINNIKSLKKNPRIVDITFENEIMEIDFGENGKFLAAIKKGHSSHMIVTDILRYLELFDYINIILLFSQLYPLFSIIRFNILTRFIFHCNFSQVSSFSFHLIHIRHFSIT